MLTKNRGGQTVGLVRYGAVGTGPCPIKDQGAPSPLCRGSPPALASHLPLAVGKKDRSVTQVIRTYTHIYLYIYKHIHTVLHNNKPKKKHLFTDTINNNHQLGTLTKLEPSK